MKVVKGTRCRRPFFISAAGMERVSPSIHAFRSLAVSPGQLPGLHQRDLGPSSEAQISNPASVGNAETPTFDPRGVNPKGEAVAICHGVTLFTRSQGRNFSCREVFRHEAQ